MGDQPTEYGSSPPQVASSLALMQKNEVKQRSIPVIFSRSAEVVNGLQDWTLDWELENEKKSKEISKTGTHFKTEALCCLLVKLM